jgi:hypothetical protein
MIIIIIILIIITIIIIGVVIIIIIIIHFQWSSLSQKFLANFFSIHAAACAKLLSNYSPMQPPEDDGQAAGAPAFVMVGSNVTARRSSFIMFQPLVPSDLRPSLPFPLQAIKKKRAAIPPLPTTSHPPHPLPDSNAGASLVLTSSGWKGEGVAAKAPPLVIPMSQSTFVVGRVSHAPQYPRSLLHHT